MSWALLAQRIFLDVFLHIIYFPVWWYSHGSKKVLLACIASVSNVNRQFAPGLWAKNLFVPMFGQSDWQGRIMSVFMRFFNIIFRSIALFIWIFLVFLAFLLWIFFPLFVTYMFVLSLNAQFIS